MRSTTFTINNITLSNVISHSLVRSFSPFGCTHWTVFGFLLHPPLQELWLVLFALPTLSGHTARGLAPEGSDRSPPCRSSSDTVSPLIPHTAATFFLGASWSHSLHPASQFAINRPALAEDQHCVPPRWHEIEPQQGHSSPVC